MGKLMVSFLLLLVISTSARAQLSDNFDDGDFLTNPEWTGTADGFIINNNFQLQSEHSIANTSFYLSTPNTTALEAEWEFLIQLNFNPSSANYIDVYLTASGADLTAPGITGYFVRLGNASDEISLYRKDAGSIVKIIDGIDGLLNKSNNVLKIKVTRSSTNKWSLYRDLSGTGNSFQSEGFVEDATYQSSAAFGLVITQSTASFFQKHFFDDIIIKNYVPDITPPDILSATAISESAVDVLFNEPVEAESALLFSNYAASGGLGMPVSVIVNPGNAALFHLTFDKPFTNGHTYTLNASGIKDLSGNNSGNISQ